MIGTIGMRGGQSVATLSVTDATVVFCIVCRQKGIDSVMYLHIMTNMQIQDD